MNQTDLSKALNLSGTYSLDVTPRGMSIISTTTETEVVKWHYKHVKYYAKSSKNVVTLEMGKRSPTGEGKFMFQTTVAKELFSMIHRNIKKIKLEREKKAKEDVAREVERIKEIKRRKEDSRTRHTLRPKSLSYDLEATDTNGGGHYPTRTVSRQSTLDPFVSASTIGTVADEDLIQLEGLAELPDLEDDYPSNHQAFQRPVPGIAGRNRLSMGDMLDDRLELDSVKQLTDIVYQNPGAVKRPQEKDDYVKMNPQALFRTEQIYDEPPREGFNDSFTGLETHTTADPFANVTDPFSSSANRGSFYNAEEDIFQSFDQVSSPHKTSTPNNTFKSGYYQTVPSRAPSQMNQSTQPHQSHPVPHSRASLKRQEPIYSNTTTEALRGLKDIQLDTQQKGQARPPVPKPRTMKRATKQQLDDMWGDIAGDLNLP